MTRAGDVFPGMDTALFAGAAVGGALGGALAVVKGQAALSALLGGALAAAAGAAIGVFLAAHRAVLFAGETATRRAGMNYNRDDLWDQWLDAEAVVEAEPAVVFDSEGPRGPSALPAPRRAEVRPRVVMPESGDALCLEDEVVSLAKRGLRGAVRITGPAGMGKTTALAHLAAGLPRELGVTIIDEPNPADLRDCVDERLVVYAADSAIGARHLATLPLAPWGEDEWIEYLLATARPQCGSVVARLKAASDRASLEGNPELWRIVLDRMAGNRALVSIRAALSQELDTRLADRDLRRLAEDTALACATGDNPEANEQLGLFAQRCRDAMLPRLLRHSAMSLLLAAQRIARDLATSQACESLGAPLSRELVQEVGLVVRESAAARSALVRHLRDGRRSDHPMAASILHAARIGWRPDTIATGMPRLSGAYLDRAAWNGINLHSAELAGADLSGADLASACLDGANADRARFQGTLLRGASLAGTSAQQADLSGADLASVRARAILLEGAKLEGTNLTGACLQVAVLPGACLTSARLTGADLRLADLREATLAGADFSGATLDGAVLKGLPLRHAEFRNASFAGADLSRCDLEEMDLPRAGFREARLHSALLTGSRMPDADFRGACLRMAGLAEVDWEGACLAGADLRQATFHLGTTRSGLVQSPIAGEGSRTGFYSDDYDDREYKPIEEIRKANLRNCDLRGALIDGVDFYLVDLRGAQLDRHQAEPLRRCGAILHNIDAC
jgi:uncharacterized protein YjbI with pentapeptide repeats